MSVPDGLVDACTRALRNGLPEWGMWELIYDMKRIGDRPLFWLGRP